MKNHQQFLDKYFGIAGVFYCLSYALCFLCISNHLNDIMRGMFYTSSKNGNAIWEMLDYAFSDKHTNFKELQGQYIDGFKANKDTSIIKKQIINLLNECAIGFSDVICECEAIDSSDGSITKAVINPELESLCINADVVLLNGSTAGKLFKKECKKWNRDITYFVMPSTSNAQGRYVKPKNVRIEEWSNMIKKYRK